MGKRTSGLRDWRQTATLYISKTRVVSTLRPKTRGAMWSGTGRDKGVRRKSQPRRRRNRGLNFGWADKALDSLGSYGVQCVRYIDSLGVAI